MKASPYKGETALISDQIDNYQIMAMRELNEISEKSKRGQSPSFRRETMADKENRRSSPSRRSRSGSSKRTNTKIKTISLKDLEDEKVKSRSRSASRSEMR
jgi:hypothetical protein